MLRRAKIDGNSSGHCVLYVLDELRESDLAFIVRGASFQSFNHGPAEIALLLFRVFVGALADTRGIDCGERLNFAIAHIKVEGVDVSIAERIGRVGAAAGIVAAGVEQQQDLAHAGFLNP